MAMPAVGGGDAHLTDTTDPAEHLLHHPQEAATNLAETVLLPGMMGMMDEMMVCTGARL